MSNMFGSLLKERREKANLSAEDLAMKAEVSTDTILKLEVSSKIEDNSISVTELSDIADALNIEFSELINSKVCDKLTPKQWADHWDMGGKGTLEQRFARLVAHAEISYGRAGEILGFHKWQKYPSLPEGTGCDCEDCKYFVEDRCRPSDEA